VARSLYDLAFGGIYDDAYSRTLHVPAVRRLRKQGPRFGVAGREKFCYPAGRPAVT
jgi:hypothetical protein